jgi:hypothetical protein
LAIILLVNIPAYSQNKDVDSISIDLEEYSSVNKTIPPSPFGQVRSAYNSKGNLKYIDNANYAINSKENGFGKVDVKPYSLSFNFEISSIKSSFDTIIPLLVINDLIDSTWIQTFGEGRREPSGIYILIGSEVDIRIVQILFDYFQQSKIEINALSLFNYKNDPFMDNKTISLGSFISGETTNMIVVKDAENIKRLCESKTHEQMIRGFYEYNENKNILMEYLNAP